MGYDVLYWTIPRLEVKTRSSGDAPEELIHLSHRTCIELGQLLRVPAIVDVYVRRFENRFWGFHSELSEIRIPHDLGAVGPSRSPRHLVIDFVSNYRFRVLVTRVMARFKNPKKTFKAF